MQAARDCGWPLLVEWGIRKRLHRKAIKLGVALRIYEDSLCRCGLSGFLTYDRHELTGHIHLKSLTCIGCEAKESAANMESNDDPWPGTKSYVTFDEGGDDDGQ